MIYIHKILMNWSRMRIYIQYIYIYIGFLLLGSASSNVTLIFVQIMYDISILMTFAKMYQILPTLRIYNAAHIQQAFALRIWNAYAIHIVIWAFMCLRWYWYVVSILLRALGSHCMFSLLPLAFLYCIHAYTKDADQNLKHIHTCVMRCQHQPRNSDRWSIGPWDQILRQITNQHELRKNTWARLACQFSIRQRRLSIGIVWSEVVHPRNIWFPLICMPYWRTIKNIFNNHILRSACQVGHFKNVYIVLNLWTPLLHTALLEPRQMC